MKKILMAENLVKSFGVGSEKTTVLDAVSVEINEGEFVAVMGPSGSGKTSLIFALSGMDDFDTGKVTFEDHDINLKRKRNGRSEENQDGVCFSAANHA
ncbi:MAG: ATP-binding cassette domain-containing protein [Alkalibacterium sp.]|nr:ATP-binding cassette domain-containing protein [Alkalibacterium sp.]